MVLGGFATDPGDPAKLDMVIIDKSERTLVHVHIFRRVQIRPPANWK